MYYCSCIKCSNYLLFCSMVRIGRLTLARGGAGNVVQNLQAPDHTLTWLSLRIRLACESFALWINHLGNWLSSQIFSDLVAYYELDFRKLILYAAPIQSILGKLSVQSDLLTPSATPERFHTTCGKYFHALPATTGREQAMDAGCGLPTRESLPVDM